MNDQLSEWYHTALGIANTEPLPDRLIEIHKIIQRYWNALGRLELPTELQTTTLALYHLLGADAIIGVGRRDAITTPTSKKVDGATLFTKGDRVSARIDGRDLQGKVLGRGYPGRLQVSFEGDTKSKRHVPVERLTLLG